MQLRDYQSECIDSLWRFWKERPGENPLLVLPTGAGKTVIGSEIMRRISEAGNSRILFLAHRHELIVQTEEKLRSVWSDAKTGIYAASAGRKEFAPITIASRDTLVRVAHKAPKFNLAIIDEAHNISPNEETSYQKIIRALRSKYDRTMFLGLTATPFRTGAGLIYGQNNSLFSDVAYRISLIELIQRGYLVPVTAKRLNHGVIDTTGIKTTAGDFNQKELAVRAEDIKLINEALNDWQMLAHDRHVTLFFCVSLKHAHLTSNLLRQRGFNCPIVHGGTPKVERDAIINAAKARLINGVVNVGVMTEGTDIPSIDCIAMLRPTKSLGLYIQMVGRGMRLFEGKSDCLLLDFGGCIDRFGPIDIASPPFRANSRQVKTTVCPCCAEIISVFSKKCPRCQYELKPPAVKDCPVCGTSNPSSAKECMACGKLFVDHATKASEGAVLSIDLKEVKSYEYAFKITASKKVSKAGNPYLLITFIYGLGCTAFLPLMIGYPGLAGKKAESLWRKLTKDGSRVPISIEEAEAIVDAALKKNVWITVITKGKRKEVIEINDQKPEEAEGMGNEQIEFRANTDNATVA